MIEKYSCAIPFKILQISWIFKDSRYINCVDLNVVVDWGCDTGSEINPNNKTILPYNICSSACGV